VSTPPLRRNFPDRPGFRILDGRSEPSSNGHVTAQALVDRVGSAVG
jgi:hypothetical protein